jgi:hypothetical protein
VLPPTNSHRAFDKRILAVRRGLSQGGSVQRSEWDRPTALTLAGTVRKIVCEAVIQDAGAVALAERITGD